ncbi:5916_t:CDS:1, partial [Scutellospora calospora]
ILNIKVFYDKKSHKENKACIPSTSIPEDICCSIEGNMRTYEYIVSSDFKLIDNITDPKTCCKACYKNPE